MNAAEIPLELVAAANAAARRLPRRASRERVRLELAVLAALKLMGGPLVVFEKPTVQAALEQFKNALHAAFKSGVDRREMVILFNGDEDRS